MDKKIRKQIDKQIEELGLTAEMLQNTQETIEIDVSGCREEIETLVAQLNLSMEDSSVRKSIGGDYVVITGTATMIVTLLQMIQTAYGAGFEIGVTSLAGAAVIMSSVPAIKLVLDKVKKKQDDSKS